MWGKGWQRYVFPAFWLIYLGQTVDGVHQHSTGAAAIAGYAIVVAFAACYLIALPLGWGGRQRYYWILYTIALALTALECFFAHGDALVFLVYISVLTVAAQRREALFGVLVIAAVGTFLPPLVPAWHDSTSWDLGLTILLVSLAMFGFFKIIQSNVALTAARAEVARLAAENERSRIARDLHDLLGHSLTTITVKAGLARRLGERGESERALAEIAEVEALSRRTLGDVRAAVSAHREVTLTGELATAGEVLRAAGIIAQLPPSVVETAPELSELFGWIVREGTTNIVRHSRAVHAWIKLERHSIEIVDDGRGGSGVAGNGLTGLRERVEAKGGELTTTTGLGGFRLRVEVPPALSDAAADPATATTSTAAHRPRSDAPVDAT
jgi:two-component system sensor histidine kinase DesK